MATYLRTNIHDGWTFKQADKPDSDFRSVAQFPTVIHLDLLHHGLIPDPPKDRNSELIQWVGEKQWLYRTSFTSPQAPSGSGKTSHTMVFDGLDTYAKISLNGKEIASTANMFLQYRVDVTDTLKSAGGENTLELLFDSAFLEGKRLEKAQGYKNLFWNGDSCRMNVRKIGCHFGWDWAPTLLTCGPWRPVYLESFVTRIADLNIDIDVTDSLDSATVNANLELQGPDNNDKLVQINISGPDDETVFTGRYGTQPLYTVTATLGDQKITRKVGIRHLRLIQRPLEKGAPGTTFFFQVNQIPIYCRGANWVPGDTFLPRINAKRYRQWIELALHGNQNMIRVWGGGLYEDDSFYEICDELGILIWHDFQLGCGVYPVSDFMTNTIREEAIYNLKRLRHHPSIVLWCGNNEDHMFAELHHLEYDINDKNPDNWLKTNWAARWYYDKMLPDICTELVPRVPYHNSSPWGGSYSNDATVGDIHSWRSRTFDNWFCAPEDQRTLSMYLIDNQKHNHASLSAYVYATQLNQAEATDYALRPFRRLWKGPGQEECAGSLIWQLNDCFPAASWSLADAFLRPKLAYFVAKRDYAPIIVGCTRTTVETPADEFTRVYIKRVTTADVWASNCTVSEAKLTVTTVFYSVLDGKLLASESEEVALPPNRSIELRKLKFEEDKWGVKQESVVVATKLTKDGAVLARYINFPQPLRHLDLTATEVTVTKKDVNVSDKSFKLAVSVKNGVAKGVELMIDSVDPDVADSFTFSDNALDLVPGEEQIVIVTAVADAKIDIGEIGVVEQHYGSISLEPEN
ncbi:beta-mannosidase [Trichoderma gamsii]|uniref:beta-mannosidase n=1 Tax=Trichoderma gamsii TaxID=398673 RepID=A0A2P4ZUQ4_9HYPO|nr:beta-mannosidase [Trichoderma gamsii]PON28027.1 beta-mannosidase [Trichoderma gamsii]